MPPAGQISLRLSDIAARLGGDVLGDPETVVTQVASLASARHGEISFLTSAKYRTQLATTGASAVILHPTHAEDTPLPRIVTKNPYAYYARVAQLLNPVSPLPIHIHSSAVSDSPWPAAVAIAANVVLGREVSIGAGSVLHPGVVLGDGVRVGQDCILYPGVVVYPGCVLGDRVVLHAGAVIGADGFGFAPDAGAWVKIPQIGKVRIGNDVEIGAKTTVDRGALDDTVILDGCKLDNQIQVGHNCVIGPNTVISGCTAIAGSTRIGAGCMIGGAAMITGHLQICDGAIISAGTFVAKNITRPGQYTSVFPVESHDRWLQNAAQIRHLAKMAERVTHLEKKLKHSQTKD